MRLTDVLNYRHAKYYYFAPQFHWGLPKYKESGPKHWRRQLILHKNLAVKNWEEQTASIPNGYNIENAVDVAKLDFQIKPLFTKDLPWPFNAPRQSGTKADKNFKEETILAYDRRFVILEGHKGAANFTNTVIESENSLPELIQTLEQSVNISDEYLELLDRQLIWSTETDGFNLKKPRVNDFAKMNKRAVRTFGPSSERKEICTLNSYHEVSELLATKLSGFSQRRKVISPELLVSYIRDGKKILTDLRSDFITLTPSAGPIKAKSMPIFDKNSTSTVEKKIPNIVPINWEICFKKTHFYPDNLNFSYSLPENGNVHTIFLGLNFNSIKFSPDRFMKARVIMALYGHSVKQARHLYGDETDMTKNSNYGQIEKPITMQCVFINQSKKNLGFACFQLNTLSFDSEVKNQVWFDKMYDVIKDRKEILQKLTAFQINGFI